jgi:hypothetical protein
MGSATNPRARREGLLVRSLPGELLVYDLERHQAHCLNRTAALVFTRADGQATVDDIARALKDELDIPGGDRLAWVALDRLDQAHLLDEAPKPPRGLAGPSRRDLLRRVGLAAALLPVVSSILAPTAAEAANTCVTDCAGQGFGVPCYNSNSSDCGILCACDGAGNCLDNQGTGPGTCP